MYLFDFVDASKWSEVNLYPLPTLPSFHEDVSQGTVTIICFSRGGGGSKFPEPESKQNTFIFYG